MSGRRALSFLSIAQRCAAQGEKGRAIVTVVNALRYHPECMDDEPSPVDFLAENYVPGFEEELNRLRTIYPAFGERLTRALYARGREDVIGKLQRSFEAYCVEQMKMAHASYGSRAKPMRQHEAPAQNAPFVMQPPAATQREVLERLDGVGRFTASAPAPRSSQNFRRIARTVASSDEFVAVTRQSQFAQPIDPLTQADQSLLMALQTGVPELPRNLESHPATSMEFDGMRIPLDDAVECSSRLATASSVNELSALLEMPELDLAVTPKTPSVHEMPSVSVTIDPQPQETGNASDDLLIDTDYLSQVALSSISRHKRASNTETPSPAHRFDRLRALAAENRKNETFVEDGTQRVIYDFDNCVSNTMGTGGYKPPTELTPYRTFEEERAEFLAANPSRPRFSFTSTTLDPFERVAEVARSLDTDTPSVTPAEPEPRRFTISATQLAICVAICVIGVFSFITWKSSEPELAREAMRGMGDTFISAAEAGEAHPALVTAEQAEVTVKPFADAFRVFFDVWQSLYFTSAQDYIFDETMPADTAANAAAKILWLTSHDRAKEARVVFDETTQSIWRGAEYFKRFSEALLDESDRDFTTAARRYARLQNSPIASFALTRLALLAFHSDHPEVRSTFEKIAYSPTEPLIAQCARALISHGAIGLQPGWRFDALTPSMQAACGIASALRSTKLGILLSPEWLNYLKTLVVSPELDTYRIEALVEGSLFSGNVNDAASWFKQYALSPDHPDAVRIQRAIMQRAFDIDALQALHVLNENIPQDIAPLEVARLMDTADLEAATSWGSYVTRFSSKRPTATLDNANAYTLSMNNAWSYAIAGDYARSLSTLRALRSRLPDAWEPLMLQAELLYRTGQAKDAAANYEVRLLNGEGGIVSVVMSNLYRVRGGLTVNAMAYALYWYELTDPDLESARCEILHAMKAPMADTCSDHLSKRKLKRSTKQVWFDRNGARASQNDLNRAGSGALSVPGFHLRLARIKLASGAVRDSVKSFMDAILFDPLTATPDTVYELENVFVSKKRRYEGYHAFEQLISRLESRNASPEVLAAAHHAAATMYQPSTGNSQAKQHLLKSIALIGDNDRALHGMIQYYEGKDKPEQLYKWQRRLKEFENPSDEDQEQ